MAGLTKRMSYDAADITYEAVDANLKASVLVIPSATATEAPGLQGIKIAGDAAVTVLGVAAKDCVTAANRAALSEGSGPAPANFPFVDASVPTATTAVYNDFVGKVEYTAAAVAYGVRLCAAANGKVRAWVSGTDPADSVVGWCAQPGGVSSSGGFALARILV